MQLATFWPAALVIGLLIDAAVFSYLSDLLEIIRD